MRLHLSTDTDVCKANTIVRHRNIKTSRLWGAEDQLREGDDEVVFAFEQVFRFILLHSKSCHHIWLTTPQLSQLKHEILLKTIFALRRRVRGFSPVWSISRSSSRKTCRPLLRWCLFRKRSLLLFRWQFLRSIAQWRFYCSNKRPRCDFPVVQKTGSKAQTLTRSLKKHLCIFENVSLITRICYMSYF